MPDPTDTAKPEAKLTVTATSGADGTSETVAFDADRKVASTTDARGRVLVIRKLNAMHKLDLSQLIGAEGVHNDGVVGPCSMAWSVTEIDGDKLFPCRTYEELRALVGRLDDDGIAAVEAAVVKYFGIQGAPDPEKVKNS